MDAQRIRTTESGILATGEFGYPTGHLGHLTGPQQEALVTFKQICASKGLYTPASEGVAPSHDDTTLLYAKIPPLPKTATHSRLHRRFLRARRFVPTDALQQFADTEAWRQANQIDTVYENIDLKDYEETRKLVSTRGRFSNVS